MSNAKINWAVFTKPWTMPLPELGKMVHDFGFDGIELPVRLEYQVEPENVATDLPEAVKILGDCGVKVYSVAGPTTEEAIATYGRCGIPILRVMVDDSPDGYRATEADARTKYDRMLPFLEKYGIKLGVENHYGRFVCNATSILHIIEGYDPRLVGAVLCLGHCAIDGETAEKAIDIVWPHLAMVFLKNAVWRRTNDPDAEIAEFDVEWTTGKQGIQSWPAVARELTRRGYEGVINLNAEYDDMDAVKELVVEDLEFAKSLF